MKAFHAVAAAALLLSSSAWGAVVTQTMVVSGWHCEHCAQKTTAALKKIKGVKEASADLDKKQIKVTYDDKVATKAQLKKAVTHAHFKVVAWK